MTEIEVWYEGDLSTRCVHSGNKAVVRTDGPKELQGKGEVFSPTDLFAASLGSCMLTLMGVAAKKLQFDMKGMHCKVNKEMIAAPVRRIGRIDVVISFDRRPPDDVIAKLKHAAETCPVEKSLHPDIVLNVTYHWGND